MCDWFLVPVSREHKYQSSHPEVPEGVCGPHAVCIKNCCISCISRETSDFIRHESNQSIQACLFVICVDAKSEPGSKILRIDQLADTHIHTHKYTHTLLKVRKGPETAMSFSKVFICGALFLCHGGSFLPPLYPAVLGPLASSSERPIGRRRWRVCQIRG